MGPDIRNIIDYLKYVTYPQVVAVAILINDTMNLHIREDNITSYRTEDEGSRSKLTIELDSTVRSKSTGTTYDGTVKTLYDKIDASEVFPNGFYSHKRVAGSQFSVKTMLELLKRNTRVNIRDDEYRVVTDGDQTYLEFLPSSIFWKGRVLLSDRSAIEYDHTGEVHLTDVITTVRLNGLHLPIARVVDQMGRVLTQKLS